MTKILIWFKSQWPIWALLFMAFAQMILFSQEASTLLPLLVLAFFQNVVSRLASRARQRNSTVYHFIAMICTNLVLFSMLKWLITNNLTLFLFLPYVAGTVTGSITGAKISMVIERYTGAVTYIKDETTDILTRYGPLGLLFVVLMITLWFGNSISKEVILMVVGLRFVESCVYVLNGRAGNRNKPQTILYTSLLIGGVMFLTYAKLIANQLNWALFIPYTVGSVSGSLVGVLLSIPFEKRSGASADAHVLNRASAPLMISPIIVFSFIALVFMVCSDDMVSLGTLFGLVVIQSFSFLLVSRAGNRNNTLYHVIASLFSNGIWFLALRQLYLGSLAWPLFVPYVCGTVVGNLIAYNIATRVEQKIKAVADPIIAPPQTSVTI